MLISARVTLVILWLFTNLVDRAFDGFVVPFLGVIFLPPTTLMYVLFWSPVGGVNGWEWILVALGVIADVGCMAAARCSAAPPRMPIALGEEAGLLGR